MMGYYERGLSAEAIASKGATSLDFPHDPGDFRRCENLLRLRPSLRTESLPVLAAKSPTWARLVSAWDEIHALIEREVPDYLSGGRGTAPLAYALMCRVRADGVACTDCSGSGRAEPCAKCKGTGRRCGGRCRADECQQGYHPCRSCRGYGYTEREATP
jgi:hypothetical protein